MCFFFPTHCSLNRLRPTSRVCARVCACVCVCVCACACVVWFGAWTPHCHSRVDESEQQQQQPAAAAARSSCNTAAAAPRRLVSKRRCTRKQQKQKGQSGQPSWQPHLRAAPVVLQKCWRGWCSSSTTTTTTTTTATTATTSGGSRSSSGAPSRKRKTYAPQKTNYTALMPSEMSVRFVSNVGSVCKRCGMHRAVPRVVHVPRRLSLI